MAKNDTFKWAAMAAIIGGGAYLLLKVFKKEEKPGASAESVELFVLKE